MILKNWRGTDKNKNRAVLLLRVGLGLTFIYAGLNILIDASAWLGFVPHWLKKIINPETFLFWHGLGEVGLGVLILIGFFLPLVSLIAFFDLTAILIFYGIDLISFRDFGLLTAALALAVLTWYDLRS